MKYQSHLVSFRISLERLSYLLIINITIIISLYNRIDLQYICYCLKITFLAYILYICKTQVYQTVQISLQRQSKDTKNLLCSLKYV